MFLGPDGIAVDRAMCVGGEWISMSPAVHVNLLSMSFIASVFYGMVANAEDFIQETKNFNDAINSVAEVFSSLSVT